MASFICQQYRAIPFLFFSKQKRRSLCSAVAYVSACDIVRREFELQSRYYIHF